MLFSIFLYLAFGFALIAGLGRQRVLTVTQENRWGLAWLLWPLTLALLIYLLLNELVTVVVYWDNE